MICENFRYRGPKQPCMLIFVGEQEELYNQWFDADPDDPKPKPDPTFIFSEQEMNELTISWLTGPPGPAGPMGPMGASGRIS